MNNQNIENRILSYTDNLTVPWTSGAVLVGGCFDILHYGHIQFIQAARRAGDILVIALESDEYIKSSKKRTPIHTQDQRAHILGSLRDVDYVVKLPPMDGYEQYRQLVKVLRPSAIAMTAGDVQEANKTKQAEELGIDILIVTPRIDNFSTSNILHQ